MLRTVALLSPVPPVCARVCMHTHTHTQACSLLFLKYVGLMKRLILIRAMMRGLRKRLGKE